MHLFVCFLLALPLPVTMAADVKYGCTFFNQMWGDIQIYVGNDPSETQTNYLRYRYAVDYRRQRCWITSLRAYSNIDHFLDFENNKMYSYEGNPFHKDTSVPCTFSHLPEVFKLPSKVPPGLKVTYNSSGFGHYRPLVVDWYRSTNDAELYSFLPDGEQVSYLVEHGADPCRVYWLKDVVKINSTALRIYSMTVRAYKVNIFEDYFSPDTTKCTPGAFPW